MSVSTGAGAKIYIGTSANFTTQVGYEGDTWTEISQVESIGEFGDSSTPVTFVGLGDARVQKIKGSLDAGNISVVMAYDETAYGSPLTGQGLLLAAAEDTTSTTYNIKIEFNDATSGSPLGTPSTRYFAGQVGTFVESVDSADDILRLTCEIRINTAIIRVGRT